METLFRVLSKCFPSLTANYILKKQYNYQGYRYGASNFNHDVFYYKRISDSSLNCQKEVSTREISNLIHKEKGLPISLKCAKKKLGRPKYAITFKEIKDNQVIGYYHYLGKYRVKLTLHFLKNELFLYSYNFKHLKENEKNQVLDTLVNKYETPSFDTKTDFVISDDFGKYILIEQSVNFKLTYVMNQRSLDTINNIEEKKRIMLESKNKRKRQLLFQEL